LGWLELREIEFSPEEIEKRFVEWCRRSGGEVEEDTPAEGVKEVRCRFGAPQLLRVREARRPRAISISLASESASERFEIPKRGLFVVLEMPRGSAKDSEGLTSETVMETSTSEVTLTLTRHHFYLRTD